MSKTLTAPDTDKALRPLKLLVAFSTKLVPGFDLDKQVGRLSPPANYKSEDAIAKWRAEKREELATAAASQPYTGTFAEVRICDTRSQETGTWKATDDRKPNPGGTKPAVALAVRDWLLKRYPAAWPHATHFNRGFEIPQVILVGFNTRMFIKMLGIECSLPVNASTVAGVSNVCPLSLWYSNTDHRDIASAVMPEGFKYLDWDTVLTVRGLRERFAGWNGPHENVTTDLALATVLAQQLGMIDDGVRVTE